MDPSSASSTSSPSSEQLEDAVDRRLTSNFPTSPSAVIANGFCRRWCLVYHFISPGEHPTAKPYRRRFLSTSSPQHLDILVMYTL